MESIRPNYRTATSRPCAPQRNKSAQTQARTAACDAGAQRRRTHRKAVQSCSLSSASAGVLASSSKGTVTGPLDDRPGRRCMSPELGAGTSLKSVDGRWTGAQVGESAGGRMGERVSGGVSE
eukprot:365386-Chlamydomonas_euryale.AAC.1